MPALRAVFFDVDGVLLDSLPQHLAFCELKSREYRLDVRMPSVQEFKTLVSRGVPVSPMLNFFLAVGFPEASARRAVREYEREFSVLFPPKLFSGVDKMLAQLHGNGFSLGLVTSNVRENVEPPLRQYLGLFDQRTLFFFDRSGPTFDKRGSLLKGAQRLGLPPFLCAFVGDQPADAAAAHLAGFYFLGVSYGWGFPPGATEEKIVDRTNDIAPTLIAAGAQ
jgi:phosphoglycolate phosphatase-like HAD superfamily hydrolase